jgi:thiosulfate dehydrogenase (quinone) large subunit
MNNSPSPAPAATPITVFGLTGHSLAFLALRLWLGARALVTGLEKYSAKITVQEPLLDAAGQPDLSGAMIDVEKKIYGLKYYHALPDTLQTKFAAEPLLPGFLSAPFYALLGPALLVLGVLLLIGAANRLTLFAMGGLYAALTFGLLLIGQDAGVSWLAIHVGLVALALTLVDHNRFAVTRA